MRDLQKLTQYAARRKRSRRFRGVLTAIAAVVVFCTTYALILPAITLEGQTVYCGFQDHTHTEDCYQLACGKEEFIPHYHSAECRDENGELVCHQEETTIHVHSDKCKVALTCTQPQREAHQHSEGCYETQSVLVCGSAEAPGHTHGEGCYQSVNVCGLEETPGHTHGEGCYAEDGSLSCTQEEAAGHIHSEGCFTSGLVCTQEETPGHSHTESCYQAQSVLVCQKEEGEGHTHNDDCYGTFEDFRCGQEGKEAHGHTASCFTLACDAHVHTEECYVKPQEDPTQVTGEEEQTIQEEETIEENEEEIIQENEEAIIPEDEGEAEEPSVRDLLLEIYTEEELQELLEAYPDCTLEDIWTQLNHPPAGGEPSGNWQSPSGDEQDPAPQVNDKVTTTGTLNEENLQGTTLSATDTKYNAEKDTFSASVTVSFSFPGIENTTAVSAGTVYVYNYPEGVIFPEGLVDGKAQTLYDIADHKAGTYTFVDNGNGTYSVKVVFSEDYVATLGTGTEHPVKGFVKYSCQFSGSDLKNDGLHFGDDGYVLSINPNDITYPKDTTESYDIDVSKSGSWVQDGDNLVYTVYVRTHKGTPNPISFTDTMANLNGLTLGDPTVTVEKGTSVYYQNWDNSWNATDNNDWSAVSDITPGYSSGTLNISLPALTASKRSDNGVDGETYKITYTYPITDYPIADQDKAEADPENNVTVSAKDSNKGQTVTDSAKTTVQVSKDVSYTVGKNGAIASDKAGYIKWTVTVNSNKQDLVKAELTDEMLKLVKNAEDVTIAPDSGAKVNTTDGKITFSPDANGVNKNTYTITYYTPVKETWDGSTVNNKATLDPDPSKPDDEKEATASVTVSGVQLGKTGSHNAETDTLDWVITVNSGKLDIAGATLTDEMFSGLSEGNFTIEPNSDGLTFIKDTDDKITGITFDAVKDGKNTQNYTIKYSTAVPTTGETASVTNKATLSPGDGKIGTPIPATSTVTLEEAKLSKGGNYDWGKGGINWTVTVNENHKNIATAVFTDSMLGQLTSGDIVIQDGNWNVISADSKQYTINTEAGKVTGIVFNPIGDTGVNTNQYIITYFTSAPQEWKDKTVHNEAKLTLDGKDIIVPADVTVPSSGNIAKSAGGGTVSEDGSTITIPWTVTLTIPKGGLPISTIIIDDVTKKDEWTTNTNQWITTEQANALIAAGMTWTDDNGNVKENVVLSDGQVTFTGNEDAYMGFEITFQDGLTPPEGATKLTFTYFTTAELTSAAIGQTKFYNFVNAGGKQTGAEYVYYKPGIQKTDGNWQSDPTTVSNSGSLTWKVKANVGMGNTKLTLIDTLPEGVTLDSLHLTGWSNLNVTLTVAEDGTISGTDTTDPYSVDGNYNAATGVITLDITPQTVGSTIQDGAEFILTVNCQVTDATNVEGSKTLTNKATMKLDDKDIGSSSQTQEWTYEADTIDVVYKTGEWDNNGRLLNYKIIINPEEKNLVENSDTFNLVDVLTYDSRPWIGGTQYDINIALVQSAVELKEAGEGGAKVNVSWTYSTEANQWNSNIQNTLTLTGIPDETALELTYSYKVTSSVPEGVEFDLSVSNNATLYGDSNYSSNDKSQTAKKWTNQSSSAGVSGSVISLKLTKVDAANNGMTLEKAEFTISAWESQTVEGVTTAAWVVKGTETTDKKSGSITIQQGKNEGERVYQTDVLYKIVETKAPDGYELPESPTVYYFYFSGEDSESMAVPDGFSPSSAIDLTKVGNSYLVKNTKIPTTEIEVEKQWKDKNGNALSNPSTPVTIHLYRKTTPGSSSGSSGGDVTVTFNVEKHLSDTGSACAIPNSVVCKAGSTFTVTVSTWGTPVLYANGNLLAISKSENGNSNGSYNWIAQFTANENTTITGCADNTLNGTVTYSYVEPDVTPDPGNSGNGNFSTDDATLVESVELSNTCSWSHTFTDLPKTGLDENNQTVTYYYYVVEDPVANYETSYDVNGIQSGKVVVTNKTVENPSYTLPATGGLGTTPYTMGGLLLIVTAGIPLLYSQTKRKKGDCD